MKKYGIMVTDVHLISTGLKLKRGQLVELEQATNLPYYLEDRLWFASIPEFEDGSILVNEDEFEFVKEG